MFYLLLFALPMIMHECVQLKRRERIIKGKVRLAGPLSPLKPAVIISGEQDVMRRAQPGFTPLLLFNQSQL